MDRGLLRLVQRVCVAPGVGVALLGALAAWLFSLEASGQRGGVVYWFVLVALTLLFLVLVGTHTWGILSAGLYALAGSFVPCAGMVTRTRGRRIFTGTANELPLRGSLLRWPCSRGPRRFRPPRVRPICTSSGAAGSPA